MISQQEQEQQAQEQQSNSYDRHVPRGQQDKYCSARTRYNANLNVIGP